MKLNKPEDNDTGFPYEDLTQGLMTKALDASISGIIITDNRQPDNPIIYCNTAFLKISGYSRTEIIGHNCRFLQGDDRTQKERILIREAVKKGEACVIEIRNYRKNGELFWNELSVSPIHDKEGKVSHFIGVQNDVSLRKKVEQDLRQQQGLMEKQIAERTKSLKESELFLSSIIQTVRESLLVLDPLLQDAADVLRLWLSKDLRGRSPADPRTGALTEVENARDVRCTGAARVRSARQSYSR